MGFLDSIFGKDDDENAEGLKGPSMVLREAGIDPSGLKFQFSSDNTVTVTGEVMDEARRARIQEVLEGMDQIKAVDNQLVIAVPQADPLPETDVEPDSGTVTVGGGSGPVLADEGEASEAPSPGPEDETDSMAEAAETPTYTVQSGDTLWKIAQEAYGNGAEYMKIFEANRDQLDNPDLIRPGQVLKIPPNS
jgi:nucleoid-associated protein YgaU